MQHIDEPRLESDLDYRFEYLAGFIGFGEDDIRHVHGAADALGPHVPALVDAVYDKLFQYDATKRHFVPKQTYWEGDAPIDIESLELDHPMIEFRKEHLGKYLIRLVTKPYDGAMAKYLDNVGKMHTEKMGSEQLAIPLVQMNSLMGFVADAMTATIMSLGLDRETEIATVRAFGKLLWIQNDLITRHYTH